MPNKAVREAEMKAKHVPMPYLTKCYNFILDEGVAVPRHTPQVDVVCDLDLGEQGRRHWLQHHAVVVFCALINTNQKQFFQILSSMSNICHIFLFFHNQKVLYKKKS